MWHLKSQAFVAAEVDRSVDLVPVGNLLHSLVAVPVGGGEERFLLLLGRRLEEAEGVGLAVYQRGPVGQVGDGRYVEE